jgi:hypothetical protein
MFLSFLGDDLFWPQVLGYDATPNAQYASADVTPIQSQINSQKLKAPKAVGELAEYTEFTMGGFSTGMKTFREIGIKIAYTYDFLQESWMDLDNVNAIERNYQYLAKIFAICVDEMITESLFSQVGTTDFAGSVGSYNISDWTDDPAIDTDYIKISSWYRKQVNEKLGLTIGDGDLFESAALYDDAFDNVGSIRNREAPVDEIFATKRYNGKTFMNSLDAMDNIATDLSHPARAPFNGKKINFIGFGNNMPSVKFRVDPRRSILAGAYYNAKQPKASTNLRTNVPTPLINIYPVMEDPKMPDKYQQWLKMSVSLDVPYAADIMLGHVPNNETSP